MSKQVLTLGVQPTYRVVGTDGGASGPSSATGLATNRAIFLAPRDMVVRAIVAAGSATAAAPTAAQLAGIFRVALYRVSGTAGRKDTSLSVKGDADLSGLDVVFDTNPRCDAGSQGTPVSILVRAGESLVLELSQGLDTGGAAFALDAVVSVYAEPVGGDAPRFTAR